MAHCSCGLWKTKVGRSDMNGEDRQIGVENVMREDWVGSPNGQGGLPDSNGED